jgi:hypothetical protein
MDNMKINRYNYQEFFLLYTDNELKTDERKIVEIFVQQNPDLEKELMMLQRSILKPDSEVVFENKELLLQFDNTASFIHPGNFDEFAVGYADNELSDADKNYLEDFICDNPDFQREFDLIQSLKLSADDTIVFPDKELLYRNNKERKPVIIQWWRMAAAAIILLSAGLLWLNKRPASLVSLYLAQTTKPVHSRNSDTIKKSGKEKDRKLDSQTDALVAALNKSESIVIRNKKSSHIDKKKTLEVKTSTRQATDPEQNDGNQARENTKNFVAGTDKQGSPRSAQISNKLQAAPNTRSEDIVSRGGLMAKNNKKIVEQPVIKINALNKNDYTIVTTVADVESDEHVLLTSLDKKNPLRGILRKASRFIDKNTALRTPKKSSLYIGNIEIAFQ